MKYVTLNPIASAGLAKLPASYERVETIENADAALVRSFSMLDMEFPASLKAIARAGAGVNNIPLERCAELGIVVFNTPGANANGVKELTVLGLLLASRDAKGGMKWVEENRSDENIAKTMEKAKSKFAGTELSGKTLGIVGLGAIGALLANAAVGLQMKVVGYDPYLSMKAALSLDPSVTVVSDVADLYRVSDYVSIHVPELPTTKGMLNAAAFAAMKDGAALLNFARPGLVNEADLAEALASGKIRKYVTDVPSFVTANLPGVIAFPHLGASTEEAEDNCAFMAAAELTDYLENGNITNSVNFPAVTLGTKAGSRLAVLYKDAENVLSELTKAVSAAKVTKSASAVRKGYGYALFEAESFSEAVVEAAKATSGVVRVNVL